MNLDNPYRFTIVLDFDGTVVTHEYPRIGTDVGAVPVLKELVGNGHAIVLFTMRSEQYLDEAVQWFKDRDIPLLGINENPEQKSWTTSPKAFGHFIIDDTAIGAPLVYPGNGNRPYIDWTAIRSYFIQRKIIKP